MIAAGSGRRRVGWDVLVCAGLVGLVVAVYLPYALEAGWYYDDWSTYAELQDAPSGSFGDLYTTCTAGQQRSLSCLFHVGEYGLFGSHRTAYHLASMAFLALVAILGYAVLRRCRMPVAWAGAVLALLVVFPGSDSTRLWPVASVGQYVVVLHLLALLLALGALGRRVRWQAVALHVVAAALSVLAMVSYEIAVPLVAFNGLVYLAAFRSRAVLWRGAVDVGLAVAFVVYRTAVNPADPDAGIVVDRTTRQSIDRVRVLLEGAWDTWSAAFSPSTGLAVAAILLLLAAAAVVAALDAPFRRRVVPWLGLLVASATVAGVAVLVYITANDLYIPALGGTFNRLNMGAALPYCLAFVALLGVLYELVRRFTPGIVPGAAAVAVVVLAVGWHQLGISSDHKRAWEESWRVQSAALNGYAEAVRGLPADAGVLGFDTPTWESGFVPVFSATWDLRGALDFTTALDPPTAVALNPGIGCGPEAVMVGEDPFMPYAGGPPLYFVSPARGRAVRVRSQAACERRIELWGRAPFFGRTATEPGALG